MASSAEVRLAGRTAVVTGATGGIGGCLARRLAAAGARTALVARGAGRLDALARETGGLALAGDVSDPAAVAAVERRLRAAWGDGPDIVVNAAGTFALAPVAVNLRGPFLMMRAFLPALLARGSGHIVSIGSVAGRQAFPGNGAYSASKFGLRGLHAVLDQELRGTGVRCTLVEPAATDTPLWNDIDRAAHPGLPGRERMLDAEAVADAVLFALTRPPETGIPTISVERS
jgi:NADP-dependent 3-hydroxy acid dehydrogenase YdfG